MLTSHVFWGVYAPTYAPFDGGYMCFKCHFKLAGVIKSKYHRNNRMIKHQALLEMSLDNFYALCLFMPKMKQQRSSPMCVCSLR